MTLPHDGEIKTLLTDECNEHTCVHEGEASLSSDRKVTQVDSDVGLPTPPSSNASKPNPTRSLPGLHFTSPERSSCRRGRRNKIELDLGLALEIESHRNRLECQWNRQQNRNDAGITYFLKRAEVQCSTDS